MEAFEKEANFGSFPYDECMLLEQEIGRIVCNQPTWFDVGIKEPTVDFEFGGVGPANTIEQLQ